MKYLDEATLRRLLGESIPSYQASSPADLNLGFGHLFYGFARVLRPRRTLVIGSKAGFSVLCFALGIRDNVGIGITEVGCYDTEVERQTVGQLTFVDPSYSVEREGIRAWSGIGTWDEPQATTAMWETYGVSHIVTHEKVTSQVYAAGLAQDDWFDLVYVDGDHSYEGVTHDLTAFHPHLTQTGMLIAHDVARELPFMDQNTGGRRALDEVTGQLYRSVTVPVFPGLGLLTPIPLDADAEGRCAGAPKRQ